MKGKKGLILGGILLLGIGFAAVSTTLYINGNVNISANSEDFDVRFTKAVIDSDDSTSTTISEDGKTITYTTKELQALNDKSVLDFEVTNNSSLYDAEVSIECTSGEKGDYYQITKEVASTIPAKTTDKGKVEVQKTKVTTEDIEEAFTCTLTATAVERTTKDESTPGVNKNIVNSNVECLKNKEAGSCTPGTEIRYMVNDRDEKTFYVLHDDGEILTLQDTENTTDYVSWHSVNTNSGGPTVALSTLESATSGWTNVNMLTYTMGTTIFKENSYTGCDATQNCTTNKYILPERSGRARIITVQEAKVLGCSNQHNSCPNWLIGQDSYWTSSVNINSDSYVWLFSSSTGRLVNGAAKGEGDIDTVTVRAVVEINK